MYSKYYAQNKIYIQNTKELQSCQHSCFVEKFKMSKINGKTILTLLMPFRAPEQKSCRKRTGIFWPNWSNNSVRGPNTQIQIHKYTNTVWSNLQIDPTSAIFLKRKWYQDLNNNVHKSLTCKYTIQIHKYSLDQLYCCLVLNQIYTNIII